MKPHNKGGVGGGGGGGRGGDDDTKAEEARPVRLAVRSCDGGARANNYLQCGGQGEKILMRGRMRISKIVKNNFIVASAISFYPSPKSLPIPIIPPNPSVVRATMVTATIITTTMTTTTKNADVWQRRRHFVRRAVRGEQK